VTVPIYPTLQPGSVQTMLRDAGAVAAFVADAGQLAKFGGAAELPSMRQAIVFSGDVPAAAGEPWKVQTLAEFETAGLKAFDAARYESTWKAVGPDDPATIIYTSGTSGNSKGVMLTHANFISNITAALRRITITRDDTCLSFLPLSHVLERCAGHFLMFGVGATIAYAESVETVPQNLLEVRPTLLISVPRLYEKMNARILAAIEQAPPLRRRLFAWAQAAGRERVRHQQAGESVPGGLALRCKVADRLVFAKLRARVGGRMRLMISGGAPLSRSIAEFFYAAGLPILEGYGLTETSPILCLTPVERPKIGTVGPPLDNIELRIADNGEILARGPSVMQGYWNNEKATAESIRDGWFHTGDVGEVDRDGYLRITDRLKDLIVTAGGKKVAPQPIEARLKAFQYLAEAILVGDQRKYIAALVIPNFANLEALARSHGVTWGSHAELVQSPVVLKAFEAHIGKLNEELASFERIKRFRLLDRELEHKAGEITPSMKVRRSVIATTFADLIQSMYAEPPSAAIGCPPTGASEHDTAPVTPPAAVR
jgi:long-chain acyl-CoA synthetase